MLQKERQDMCKNYTQMNKKLLLFLLTVALSSFADEITVKKEIVIKTEITTNIVETTNQRGCATCEMLRKAALNGVIPAIYHPSHISEPYEAPTQKLIITNISKHIQFSFAHEGRDVRWEDVYTLNSTTNQFKLNQEWQEVK